MKTLVVGDVHGCSEELRELTTESGADRVILVGDLFTKGPDPMGVWEQIHRNGYEAVLGNHDQRLLDVIDGRRVDDTGAEAVIRRLGGMDQNWERWLRERPLFLTAEDYDIVHAGLHPKLGRSGTTKSMALSMRRWPSESAEARHWHEQYNGARGVIFGHDARGGLVLRMRKGRPWLVGLDSGCVYGGALSGFLVEDATHLRVEAKHVYRPI